MGQYKELPSNNREILKKAAERIYNKWDEYLSKNDVESMMTLYCPDATIESPLIPHLMETDSGVCHGLKEIRRFYELIAKRKPSVRKYYRTGYFTDGQTLMWEYPRNSPKGEQMDFVEIMELKGELIHSHRVYWGWLGFKILINDQYHR